MIDATMTTVLTEQHATNIGKIVLALREYVPADGRFSLPGTPWAIPLLNGGDNNISDRVNAVVGNLVRSVSDGDDGIVVALADLSDQQAADIVASMLPRKDPAVRVVEAAESLPWRYRAAMRKWEAQKAEQREEGSAPNTASTHLEFDEFPF